MICLRLMSLDNPILPESFMERYSFWLRPWPRWFFCLFVNFVVNSPLLVYAVRIAPGVPFSTTNEARVLIGSSGLVTAATMR